jgi:predicted deacylase
MRTRIWTDIDFDRDGMQSGYLRLPFSTDLSAYGTIPIPIVCIKNGPGPTALLVAGNHGDEYEGQVALRRLINSTDHKTVTGRLLIVPSLNFPAVEAGRRVSPLDIGNLNREFPGKAEGTPTQMIAHYVCSELLPRSNIVVDLHSGGRSLHYLPVTMVRQAAQPDQTKALVELMRIFGAPYGSISDGRGGGGETTLSAAAGRAGVPAVTAELGGGATLSSAGVKLAEAGINRLLQHLGILADVAVEAPTATRIMTVSGRKAFSYATSHALFEPLVDLGEEVCIGQRGGLLHALGTMKPPEDVMFEHAGIVACRRAPCLTAPGDCLFKVMAACEEEFL